MGNNQSEKTGKFIYEMRKAQNLTQKDLAEKLDVTDKAISKWERGLSCPDISLLIPLSKILDVTTSELLNGEKKTAPQQELTEATVEEALQYSSRSTRQKMEQIKKNTLVILSASFLIAAIICLICDFGITESLTWSPLVLVSLVFSWMVLLPFFQSKKKIIKKTFLVLSILIIPYLAALAWLLKESLIFRLGACVSIISIAALWCIYGVFTKLRNRKLRALGITLLLAVPTSLGINYTVAYLISQPKKNIAEDVVNVLSLLISAIICFGIDYLMAQRKK